MAAQVPDFGGLGGAVSGLFGAVGDFEEASAYSKAAKYAEQNAEITKESTAIQETQAGRMIYKTFGQQAAAEGAGNLAASGSSLDILRSSAQQGALTKQIIQQQGLVTENGYEEEANAYQGMSSAATAAGIGGTIGSILKGIGSFL